MARRSGRLLIIALGAAVAAAGAVWGWLAYWSSRFDAAGITIDPRARIDPQRQYELVVWEEAIIVPWAAAPHRDVLADALAAFQERWPNARVSYSLLDPLQARDQLAAAVAAGRPPDVYGTVRGLVLHPSYQIPAKPYFPETRRDEPPHFLPAAVGGLTDESTVWGWPRALWWDVWLADASLLSRGGVDVDRLLTQGWTWDEFLQLAARLQGIVEDVLVLDTTSAAPLEPLILNAGAPQGPASPRDRSWREAAQGRAEAFLEEVRRQGALPENDAAASRTRVERLLTGRAAIIGPVGPYLAQAILRRKPEGYVLVPIPHHSAAAETAPMVPGGYFVFRQDPYQGDDHTHLAMELAGWLAARTEAWLTETLALLPARSATWHAWNEQAPLDDRSRTFLMDYLRRARPEAIAVPDTTAAPPAP